MKRNIFALAAVLTLIVCSSGLFAKASNTRVDVIYFHATQRCQGCLTIEEFAKNSISFSFARELKDSLVTFKSLDFLADENSHFQDDYKFDTQTLIISKKVDGKEVKWKNLDKIWDLSSNFEKFRKYVEEEVKKLSDE